MKPNIGLRMCKAAGAKKVEACSDSQLDPNGQEANGSNGQVQESSAKGLILSKSYSDFGPLEFGIHGPFNSPNGCTLLSVTSYLKED